MFSLDTREIKQLEADLKKFGKTALPFASKFAVNSAAFKGRQIYQAKIKKKLINRNKFTVNSVLVIQSKTLRISKQSAILGSIAPYMEDQEFGGIKKKKGKVGTPIPTGEASGEGRISRARRKLPTRVNKLKKITLTKRKVGKFKSKKQAVFLSVFAAVKNKDRFISLELHGKQGRTKGIFRIKGKIDNKGKLKGVKMDMLYNLSHDSVRIPKTPLLKPSLDELQPLIPSIYITELDKQIDKQRLFRKSRIIR